MAYTSIWLLYINQAIDYCWILFFFQLKLNFYYWMSRKRSFHGSSSISIQFRYSQVKRWTEVRLLNNIKSDKKKEFLIRLILIMFSTHQHHLHWLTFIWCDIFFSFAQRNRHRNLKFIDKMIERIIS
jgi:hypothetical protein